MGPYQGCSPAFATSNDDDVYDESDEGDDHDIYNNDDLFSPCEQIAVLHILRWSSSSATTIADDYTF